MRTFSALLAVAALTFVGAPASASSSQEPSSAVAIAARVASVGNLFGPAAASDANYLLGVAEQSDVWAGAAGTDASTDGPVVPTSAAGHTSVAVGVGEAVEMYPGHDSGLEGVPASGRAPADSESVKLMPGDPDTHGSGAARVAGGSGGLCPVQGAVWFSDSWGAGRSGGRHHEGTDMFAAPQTPVVAMEAGVLVRVDRDDVPGSLGGRAVSYVTAEGTRWYNAHFAQVPSELHVGDYVAAGTVIGYVGDSGDAAGTPPHLHIEFHPGGGDAAPSYATMAARCK